MKLNHGLRLFLLFFFSLTLTQCLSLGKNPVTLLGLDDSGKEFHHVVSGKYGKRIGKSMDGISEESLVVLDEIKNDNPWELSRIDVGIGVTAKLEFIVVGVDVTPSFRMTFKKK